MKYYYAELVMKNLFHVSSIVVEVIRPVLFFYIRYFNYKPHKQNHLTNIQPNIYKKVISTVLINP